VTETIITRGPDFRPARIRDTVSLFDSYGRELFTVDRWIFEVAAERGDLARWGLA
jgi:hypothetical protein